MQKNAKQRFQKKKGNTFKDYYSINSKKAQEQQLLTLIFVMMIQQMVPHAKPKAVRVNHI